MDVQGAERSRKREKPIPSLGFAVRQGGFFGGGSHGYDGEERCLSELDILRAEVSRERRIVRAPWGVRGVGRTSALRPSPVALGSLERPSRWKGRAVLKARRTGPVSMHALAYAGGGTQGSTHRAILGMGSARLP